MGITIQQLSVFLENREGRLDEVLSVLAGNDINIVALSLADTSEYGMLRMIVSDPNKGKAVLKENGITSMLTDVVALRVPHETGSLSRAMHQIVEGDVNIEYMYAFAAGDVAHDCICDFYLHQNLIRIYDIKGNLLKHIQVIDNACVPSTSVELRPVFHELKFNSKYIAVLYNNKYSTEEIYSDEKLIQELQLWNWKGELKKRICFDFPFDIYAISEDDILYAVNSGRPDYIYTYDLK